MSIPLYCNTLYLEQAQKYQQVLATRGVISHIEQVEKLNARFLREHSAIALHMDEAGLWLCANGMKMQPDWKAETPRLKRASIKSEMIARACQLTEQPHVLDATGGLGHDSLLLACLGARITLLERHPILFTLLESAKHEALKDAFLKPIVEKIELIFADAEQYLKQSVACLNQTSSIENITAPIHIDVVYLDPMFPQRNQNSQKKQAQVKKQMQLLHLLLPENGHMDLGDALLPLAQQHAKRVIVKRPRHAVFLNQQTPDHQWLGDACRFDAYFQNIDIKV